MKILQFLAYMFVLFLLFPNKEFIVVFLYFFMSQARFKPTKETLKIRVVSCSWQTEKGDLESKDLPKVTGFS